MTRLIGLAPQTLVELSPLELVACAAVVGFDLVGVRLQPAAPTDREWPTIGRTPMIMEIRHRLDYSGLHVLDVEILRLKADTDVRQFEALLDTAAYLGAEQMLVVANDPDRGRLSANLWALAELSQPYGLTPNIEFMPWTEVKTVIDAAALLRETAHANTGIVVDPIHLDRSGGVCARREQDARELLPVCATV